MEPHEVEYRLDKGQGDPFGMGVSGNTFTFKGYLKGTDTPVTNQQVWEWFEQDMVLGVSVKLNSVWLKTASEGKFDRPTFGMVTDIREVSIGQAKGKVIVLDNNEEIPSELFHQWYTLD